MQRKSGQSDCPGKKERGRLSGGTMDERRRLPGDTMDERETEKEGGGTMNVRKSEQNLHMSIILCTFAVGFE